MQELPQLTRYTGTLPESQIVDIIPVLDRLPLFLKPWERKARASFNNDWQWALERLTRVKKDIRGGIFRPAFLQNVVNDENNLGFSHRVSSSLPLATTHHWCSQYLTYQYMVLLRNNDAVSRCQKIVHEEIEKYVGDRLPVWEDVEIIPYVRCLIKEVWRWRPPVALGHPHETTKELVYGG